MPYFTYVIRSESSNKIYIGQTDNLEFRLRRHNGKYPTKKGSFTKINKGPWNLIHQEMFETRHEAIIKEKQLKSHAGRDWIRKLLK